jgi:RsmE family RNA methyltransferase
MNLLLLHPEDFITPDTARVTGRRAVHAREILAAIPGDSIRAGILNGLTGKASVLAIDNDSITMKVECHTPPPPAIPATIICAMQRPKTFRKIVQYATSMGVKHLVFIESWKVDKSYWNSPELSAGPLAENIALGLEQARDCVPPLIEFKRRFKPFVEDELPDLVKGRLALLAHPDASQICPSGVREHVILAIGPEGGFTAYEVDKLTEASFTPVSLGSRILRTEVALAALVGRLF